MDAPGWLEPRSGVGADRDADPPPSRACGFIDLTRVLAGPLATMTLGDLGADVIKVERPDHGDDTRGWGPPFAGSDAAYFLGLNRNKRSVVIDLKDPAGIEAVRTLASSADILIENFRPGLMRELGLDLDDLRAANTRLITCSLTAFGDRSGDADKPGYDIIVQALSGLMSVTGEPDGEPTKAGVALLDVITGLYATVGIQAAMTERERTRRGRHVSVSLFDAAVAAMVNQASNHLVGGLVPRAMGSQHPNIVPYQLFRGSDRPFIVAGGNDRLFERIAEVMGHPGWVNDERFATNDARVRNRDVLIPMLVDVFATDTADRWIADLESAGVPCAPIRTMDEVFASPEGAAAVETLEDPGREGALRLVRNPIHFDGRRLATRMPPPSLGEHGGAVPDPRTPPSGS